jgi:hypothetical protein
MGSSLVGVLMRGLNLHRGDAEKAEKHGENPKPKPFFAGLRGGQRNTEKIFEKIINQNLSPRRRGEGRESRYMREAWV